MLQNLPSLLAAHVVAPKPGSRVLDMCAAPGGKTTAMAQLMEDRGEVCGAVSEGFCVACDGGFLHGPPAVCSWGAALIIRGFLEGNVWKAGWPLLMRALQWYPCKRCCVWQA